MEDTTDKLFKEYKEANNIRTLIETLISPLTHKFEDITAQIAQFDNRLLQTARQVQEIEVFFRRLTFFNINLERLWERMQELESNSGTAEVRRTEDMQQIRAILNDNRCELKDRADDFRLGVSRMNVIVEEYKDVVKDATGKTQRSLARLIAVEQRVEKDREVCAASVGEVKEQANRDREAAKKTKEQYVELNSEVSAVARRLKGEIEDECRFGGADGGEEGERKDKSSKSLCGVAEPTGKY